MRDGSTNTIDGAAAFERGRERYQGGDTVTLADVIDEPHDAECICEECSDEIGDKIGKEFIWKYDADMETRWYFHIAPIMDKLKDDGFYEMNSGTRNVAQYRNAKTKQIVTIKRIECADNKEL